MKGCLHIGIQKTGSTTLQPFLCGSYARLRARGCLYPLPLISAGTHNHEHRLHARPLLRFVGPAGCAASCGTAAD